MAYQEFVGWLGTSPLSELFKVNAWVVPAVQSIHILGIGVVLSCTVVIAMRVVGFNALHLEIAALNDRLIPPIWWAIAVLLATGAVLIVAEPTRTLNNPFFFAKMACLLLFIPLTRGFQQWVRKRPQRWADTSTPSIVKPAVAVVLLLLVVIIFCGRWIAYA